MWGCGYPDHTQWRYRPIWVIRGAWLAPPTAATGIAVVCGLLLLVGMPIAYFSGDTSTGDTIACFAFIGLWLIAIALLVTRFVPNWRAGAPERAARVALILGVLALITCIVFRTGLPIPLGAGAIMLGLTLRESAPANTRGKATVALGLGACAVLATFVVLLIG